MGVLDLNRGKIIGQPEVVEGFFVLNIKCSCGQHSMLVGPPGTMRPCVSATCDWAFAITGCPQDSPDGPVWKIGFKRIPKGELPPL